MRGAGGDILDREAEGEPRLAQFLAEAGGLAGGGLGPGGAFHGERFMSSGTPMEQ